MCHFVKIMTILFLFSINSNVVATETINEIKKQSKNIFKTLTRKSLKQEELRSFITEYVIHIDDNKSDGLVTYYFNDNTYQRYKDLELISQDVWKITRSGYLEIYNNKKKDSWKIQLGKENTINIKKKKNSIGNLYLFLYENKTDYYIKLEEKKIFEN